ncbi:flavodoxin [Oceanobacillus sp. Castelsardo]|uniref:flavodoxin n=1 Tax=Oceanobacillus sp. Castelsardo TaxID=1851204 RepID=UPI000837F168|nr:flavodoxin [Oceanobacillus sp. Castelsardo]
MSNILVLYASVSGNTEMMARIIIDTFKNRNVDIDVKVFDEDRIEAKDILQYDGILMGLYTWSGGELPFEVEDFYDGVSDLDLRGKVCGVFGSGDQFYDDFCGAVDIMYEQFEDVGATMIPYKVKVDMDPEGEEIMECQRLAEEVCQLVGKGV